MKVIDTREYVSVLKQLTDDGREVSMRIAGNSMAPFLIHERDTIFFRKPEAKLKKGDIVFFKRRICYHGLRIFQHISENKISNIQSPGMAAVKFKEYSLWCIYAVAKKEKNMMTKHSLYVFIILLSIYFVTLHIML